jgi:hypothetical protein
MSYRHIILKKISSSDAGGIFYEITSPDFNDEHHWEHLGIIEIDDDKKEYIHKPSEIWLKNKIYPIEIFNLPPAEREFVVRKKYSDCASGAWPLAIYAFIKNGFQTGYWEDEVRLFA